MQPTYNMYPASQEYQLQLQREAAQMRLAELAQANNTNQMTRQPLLAELGRQLTHLGQRLEQAAGKQPTDVLAYHRE